MGRVAGALSGVRPLPTAWRDGDVAAALVPRGDTPSRLAELLGCTTGSIVMSRGARGKPLLSQPADAVYSVAHRAGVSLIAAGWHRAIGVDLEIVRDDLPLDDIADTCFTAAETDWLRSVPTSRRGLAFTLVWAVKEAVLKSSGLGITDGMTDPAVHGPALLPLLEGEPCLGLQLPGLDSVQVRQGMIGPAHAVACVAVTA